MPNYLQRQIHENSSILLEETLKARRAWNDVFQALRVNNYKTILLYPAKEFFKIEGVIDFSR
jgi:hypothetical protein